MYRGKSDPVRELAGESRNEQELRKWAKAFNADTPEKVRKLASEGDFFEELAMTILKMNEDERIQQAMRMREVDEWFEAMQPKWAEARGEAKEKERALKTLAKNLNISEEEAARLLENEN